MSALLRSSHYIYSSQVEFLTLGSCKSTYQTPSTWLISSPSRSVTSCVFQYLASHLSVWLPLLSRLTCVLGCFTLATLAFQTLTAKLWLSKTDIHLMFLFPSSKQYSSAKPFSQTQTSSPVGISLKPSPVASETWLCPRHPPAAPLWPKSTNCGTWLI